MGVLQLQHPIKQRYLANGGNIIHQWLAKRGGGIDVRKAWWQRGRTTVTAWSGSNEKAAMREHQDRPATAWREMVVNRRAAGGEGGAGGRAAPRAPSFSLPAHQRAS
jgi:hypothetical protein